MGKKKLKQHQTHLEPKPLKDTQVSPKIPYNQPYSSPYELPIVTVIVGRKRYGLPGYFIQKYPQFNQRLLWSTSIDLSDAYEDVGHTLVHFLYSGSYETIDSPLEEGESKVAREYKKAVLAYRASRTYKLPALESLAKRYIKLFSEAMTTSDILQITREVFPKFSEDETWLPNHIKSSLQQFLLFGDLDTDLDALNTIFGEEHSFENVMTRMMLEILSNRLRCRGDQEDKNNRDSQIKDCETENISIREPFAVVQSKESRPDCSPEEAATEAYPKEDAVEAYPKEDAVESYPEREEAPPEEAAAEVYPEEDTAEAYPEEDAVEAYPEEDAVESYPEPEEAPPEEDTAEAYPEEDAVKSYPEPEEAATEVYPEEDAVESYPEPEEAPPEEDTAEAYPEEDAVKSYPEPEEAPPEDAGGLSAKQESLPSPNTHTSKLRLSKYLLENVHLYEDWKTLSPKKRKSRTKKLRARSLPVPDKDGVISTLVV